LKNNNKKERKKLKAFTVNFKDITDRKKNPKLSLSAKDIIKNMKIKKKYFKKGRRKR